MNKLLRLTRFGFGLSTRFPFNLRRRLLRLCSRFFAALADPPPGTARHQQGRRRFSAWTETEMLGVSGEVLKDRD